MANYYKTVDIDLYKQRLIILVFLMAAAFAILLARLFILQVIEGHRYRRLSENNCIRLQPIQPVRGLIFDRHGRRLVDNRPAFDLSIIPKDAGDIDKTLAVLSDLIDCPLAKLKENFQKNQTGGYYKPVVLQKDVGREVLARVEAHKFELPGVEVNYKPRRHYLYDNFAAHLIGYLGKISGEEMKNRQNADYHPGSYIGKAGVEKLYEDFLRGERGGRQVEVNARGQVVQVLKKVPPEPGQNLYLTIDFGLQRRTEALFSGKSGAAVAMDPFTGEILAMASSPAFDQNAFVNGLSRQKWDSLVSNPEKPMQNKAIQAEYPPASVYKMVTAMAGLEEGLLDRRTTFFCPGYYPYGDRIFRCWKKQGHGKVDVVEALAQSCDVFFYKVGEEVGVERLAWYAKACGLGRKTGIALAGEADGLVPSKKWKQKQLEAPWTGGETLNVAIGQGYNLVTPLQMVTLVSALANGGILKKPLVLCRSETAEGKVMRRPGEVVKGRIPVDEETLRLIRRGMWKTVNDRHGTAWYSVHSKEILISGKTGTAQVTSRKKDEEDKQARRPRELLPHAWFVAFAPSENPQIAVAVLVEHGEHGSSAAGPIAKKMITDYLSKAGADSS